jgi:hypothetical protein
MAPSLMRATIQHLSVGIVRTRKVSVRHASHSQRRIADGLVLATYASSVEQRSSSPGSNAFKSLYTLYVIATFLKPLSCRPETIVLHEPSIRWTQGTFRGSAEFNNVEVLPLL